MMKKKIISQVEKIDNNILSFISQEKSSLGLGGMLSKLTFTRLATSLGIRVIISGLLEKNAFLNALKGNTGTTFKAQSSNLKARQKWLASGSITIGGLLVDKGAEKALMNRKSLLTVGIKKVDGNFTAGEVVQLINEEENIIGVAKVRLGASDIKDQVSVKNALAAHADDIVVF
jgi:glutamate 5-kinase